VLTVSVAFKLKCGSPVFVRVSECTGDLRESDRTDGTAWLHLWLSHCQIGRGRLFVWPAHWLCRGVWPCPHGHGASHQCRVHAPTTTAVIARENKRCFVVTSTAGLGNVGKAHQLCQTRRVVPGSGHSGELVCFGADTLVTWCCYQAEALRVIPVAELCKRAQENPTPKVCFPHPRCSPCVVLTHMRTSCCGRCLWCAANSTTGNPVPIAAVVSQRVLQVDQCPSLFLLWFQHPLCRSSPAHTRRGESAVCW
jgi:hypothetical protein